MSVVEKETVQPVRRSRRAASLTAQVLWNIQIEDDSKSVAKVKKETSAVEGMTNANEKKCQKRVSTETVISEHKTGKKQKMNNGGYSGCLFATSKPLQSHAGDKPQKKKLTASVKPLVQQKPSTPKVIRPHSQNVVPHGNPILLLPVSLKTNQGPSATAEVGSLPVLTFQNSSDLINCFGLDKSVRAAVNPSRNAWQGSNLEMVPVKPSTILIPGLAGAADRENAGKQVGKLHAGQSAAQQDEPLNLKMGETKIPSSCRQIFAPGKVKGGSSKPLMTCTVSVPLRSGGRLSVAEVAGNVRTDRTKDGSKRADGRQGATSNPLGRKGHSARIKQETACPSPEYACSSPDVDDVHRDARHTCNRAHINLRQKAVPPPGTPEYEEYKVEQRRALADAVLREQRRKLDTKKPVLARMDSDEERPLLNPKLLANYESPDTNNGWRWAGKPYFGLVYSVECGKYVRRRCFPAMTRHDEDGLAVVMVRDCVFLCAGGDDEPPYVAKVTGLWEKPHTGDMMMSLLWYYRPEHTEDPRLQSANLCDDELFMSRHQDDISVACVEDRCHVLSYSQYCRVQARMRRDRAWRKYDRRRLVPPMPRKASSARPSLPGESPPDDGNLFFSRRMYDVKCRRVLKCLPAPGSLAGDHAAKRNSAT